MDETLDEPLIFTFLKSKRFQQRSTVVHYFFTRDYVVCVLATRNSASVLFVIKYDSRKKFKLTGDIEILKGENENCERR